MFFIIKRNNILSIILVCCMSYMTYLVFANSNVPISGMITLNGAIVIDAGHGEYVLRKKESFETPF